MRHRKQRRKSGLHQAQTTLDTLREGYAFSSLPLATARTYRKVPRESVNDFSVSWNTKEGRPVACRVSSKEKAPHRARGLKFWESNDDSSVSTGCGRRRSRWNASNSRKVLRKPPGGGASSTRCRKSRSFVRPTISRLRRVISPNPLPPRASQPAHSHSCS